MERSPDTYWAEREKRNLEAREVTTDEQAHSLAASLKEAKRQVENEVERFYRRYAQDNKISYAEAQKALSLQELREFRGRLSDFKKLAEENRGRFSLEVENLSTKARVSRYQALKVEIDGALEKVYIGMERGIKEGGRALYEDQYLSSIFDIDQYTGFRHRFAGINGAAVEKVLRYPFNGMDYSQRLWRQREDLSYRLQTTLNTMLVTGEPPEQYAKEFAEAFSVKEQEARRLLYTEHAYLAEQAKLRGYGETGVREYEILATLDRKTSPICQEQDGKRYRLGEEKVGVNCPPFHPWCRTVTIPVVEGVEARERAARDSKTGKSVQVPGNMTFGEWKRGVDSFTYLPQNDIISTWGDGMGIGLEIDKFTPCLENIQTGELVETTYHKAEKQELQKLRGWNFNWTSKNLSNSEIYKLTLREDSTIQGLVAITSFASDQACYVDLAESAPHNLGAGKHFGGVGGHLFAIAAQRSVDAGFGGFLFLDAKNMELVEHYQKLLGARLLGIPHPYRMVVDEEAAQKLIERYTLKEE